MDDLTPTVSSFRLRVLRVVVEVLETPDIGPLHARVLCGTQLVFEAVGVKEMVDVRLVTVGVKSGSESLDGGYGGKAECLILLQNCTTHECVHESEFIVAPVVRPL